MASKVKIEDDENFDANKVKYVCGFDISSPKDDETVGWACMAILELPKLEVVYKDSLFVTIDAPYCPGFLAFKEVPHFLQLYEKFQKAKISELKYKDISIDAILVDGNGILHCNACGCASHLGVILDVPTIGCGKTIFAVDGINKNVTDEIKKDFRDNNKPQGAFTLLKGKSGKVWGAGLKSGKDSVDPLIVSVGHRISIESALKLVTKCSLSRVPEPIRFVDKWSRELLKKIPEKEKVSK